MGLAGALARIRDSRQQHTAITTSTAARKAAPDKPGRGIQRNPL
ncbi:hypothetical protein PG5_36070 [Pseudomonas sp. G5(2012)]|nr:hypothetical protein PG5_36070 [Pseudomonas sp. G5(2012)]